MSVVAATLLTPTTDAANSNLIAAFGRNLPLTLVATGLGVGETVTLEVSVDGGTTWQTAYDTGNAITLTSTDNMLGIHTPGLFRAAKSATAGPSGVFSFREEQG